MEVSVWDGKAVFAYSVRHRFDMDGGIEWRMFGVALNLQQCFIEEKREWTIKCE